MDNIETAATLLLRFVTVENSTTAQECLEKLLTEYAGPMIRKITFFTLRFSAEEQDLEDVRSNVALHLITRELRKSSASDAIGDFSAYTARIAHNCCHELLRLKYPSRSRHAGHITRKDRHRNFDCRYSSCERRSVSGSRKNHRSGLARALNGSFKQEG